MLSASSKDDVRPTAQNRKQHPMITSESYSSILEHEGKTHVYPLVTIFGCGINWTLATPSYTIRSALLQNYNGFLEEVTDFLKLK